MSIFAPMIAITGCGRAGTVYTSKLFQACDLKIGHEELKEDGIISWWIAGDYAPPKGESWLEVVQKDPIVFHQIRNPLSAISSTFDFEPEAWVYIGKHIKLSNNRLKNCMAYYLFWNIRAQNKACYSYPVEHIGDKWSTILKMAGLPFKPMPVIKNDKEQDNYSWKDLKKCDPALCEQIREYAFQFYNSNLLF